MLISWNTGKFLVVLLVYSFISGNAAEFFTGVNCSLEGSSPVDIFCPSHSLHTTPDKFSAGIDTALTFSEIMFYPSEANSEFIEIFNLSMHDSIDLRGYLIKYYTSNPDTIKSAGYGSKLGPRCYAVIFEGDYNFSGGIYSGTVPADALILKISDNAFGANGMSNTTDRPVSLLRHNGDTIETYSYSASGNTAGHSDEKVFLSKQNSTLNWNNSVTINGTPGKLNSSAPPQYDLTLARCFVNPEHTSPGSPVIVQAVIRNAGSSPISNYMLKLYLDQNHDTLPQSNELLYQAGGLALNYNDSAVFKYNFTIPDTGNYCFIAQTWTPYDQDSSNNAAVGWCRTYTSTNFRRDIIFNEIMYAPSNGEPEWIELYNNSSLPVNINGFTFSDARDTVPISNSDRFIAGNGFFIIAKDSSLRNFYQYSFPFITIRLPALNNDQDKITIRDSYGRTKDSLEYLSVWGGNSGFSLERLYPDSPSVYSGNWHTCRGPGRATPGGVNSVKPKDYDPALLWIKLAKNPIFENEYAACQLRIINRGRLESGNMTLSVFADINNDSLPQPSELRAAAAVPLLQPGDSLNTQISINGFSEGIYSLIAVLSSPQDDDSSNNIAAAQLSVIKFAPQLYAVVINEIMYAPAGGEPEWIELYNKSTAAVNLRNFRAADLRDTTIISTKDEFLLPGAFIVITRDSSLSGFYQYPVHFIKSAIPILNNDGDRIMILDQYCRVEDSLTYFPVWGGSNGCSLERINADSLSHSRTNWSACPGNSRATPGRKNSASPKDTNASIIKFYFEKNPVNEYESAICHCIIKNKGRHASGIFNAALYIDVNHDSIPDPAELREIKTGSSLQPDSSLHFQFTLAALSGGTYLCILALTATGDEDTTDNISFSSLRVTNPAALRDEIAINEIMYAPAAGDAEWIELFNRTGRSINLSGFCLADALDTMSICLKDYMFNPNSYLLLAADSSFFTRFPGCYPVLVAAFPPLNNTGDKILLLDSTGRIIDSLAYTRYWGSGQGTSIERVSADSPAADSSNWRASISQNRGTPGKVNSISQKEYDLAVSGLQSVPSTPARGQSVKITAAVSNRGKLMSPPLPLVFKIFKCYPDSTETRILIPALPPGVDTIFSINESMNSDTIRVCCRISWAADEYDEDNTARIVIYKSNPARSVVITEIMNTPPLGVPQWVEIYNQSGDTINLQDWKVADIVPGTARAALTQRPLLLPPASYYLASRDSMPGLPPASYSIAAFGLLGAADDGVVLSDNHDRVIDSVRYSSDWQIHKNRSIERIGFQDSSSSKHNWHFSVSPAGSTPLQNNSCALLRPIAARDLIINEIMYEPAGSNSEFIELYNRSAYYQQIAGASICTGSHTYLLSDTLCLLKPGGYFLLFADSCLLTRYGSMTGNATNICSGTGSLGLLNTGGSVKVIDVFNSTIDSLFYLPSWHLRNAGPTVNRSLERINPDEPGTASSNWSTCAGQAGATPGCRNSLSISGLSSTTEVLISPNPFSPDDDGFQDVTVFEYSLPYKSALLTIRVFDDRGRLLRHLVSNQLNPGRGAIVFNGRDDSGIPLRMGMYIVLFEAVDASSSSQITIKKILVSARRL